MGRNRSISENKSPKEVFGQLSNEIDKAELYSIWKVYNQLRSSGNSPKKCIEYLDREKLDYFTEVGFELFNKEYIGLIKE